VLFVRQSVYDEDAPKLGSQEQQVQFGLQQLRRYGIPESQVQRIEAWGERGLKNVPREKFEELRRMIRDGHVGIACFPEIHRISRNLEDAEGLFKDAERAGTLILVGSSLHDPADRNSRMLLRHLATLAEWQNEDRTEWLVSSRLGAARHLVYPYLLPTGLIWASPDDPEYRQAMDAARLSHWLGGGADGWKRRLPLYGAHYPGDGGRTYHPLPFPDADVVAAAQLRLQWLLETRSVPEVFARIRHGSHGWPQNRAGTYPRTPRILLWRQGLRATWVPVRAKHVYRGALSPALYGIYAFNGRSLSMDSGGPVNTSGRKGKHFARRLAAEQPPLPDAYDLLGVSAPEVGGDDRCAGRSASVPGPDTRFTRGE
jgi:DNA invertase Pin-like site-specific DNA recombinase